MNKDDLFMIVVLGAMLLGGAIGLFVNWDYDVLVLGMRLDGNVVCKLGSALMAVIGGLNLYNLYLKK